MPPKECHHRLCQSHAMSSSPVNCGIVVITWSLAADPRVLKSNTRRKVVCYICHFGEQAKCRIRYTSSVEIWGSIACMQFDQAALLIQLQGRMQAFTIWALMSDFK